jgi:hypothetical protein
VPGSRAMVTRTLAWLVSSVQFRMRAKLAIPESNC